MSRNLDDKEVENAIVALRSEPLSFTLESVRAFGLSDSPVEGRLFKGTPKGIGDAERMELIAAVRAGKQVELEVPAIVYRQQIGKPNRNGLKFSTKKLAKIAKSFMGKPALVDHRTRMQSARIGTIVSSELVDGKLDTDEGGAAFRQVFRIVKPDAVISILDGTIDRFSIGWAATGPVICSAHQTEVWSECSCWPLDTVTIDSLEMIVEYEFTSAEGDETSSVNTPAVTGTKIEDVRAALTAEIRPHQTRGPKKMAFTRLAAALMLATLTDTDEDRAVGAVDALRQGKLAAETELALYKSRALEAEGKLTTVSAELAESKKAKTAGDIDAIVADAYKSGKLAIVRDAAGKRTASKTELDVRKFGATLGVEALRNYVAEMPEIIPLAQRSLAESTPEQERTDGAYASANVPAEVLESTATQLGLNPKDVAANAAALAGRRRNSFTPRKES